MVESAKRRVNLELREMSLFLEGKGEVQRTLRRLVKHLERAQIPYAVVGGMALVAHRYRRATGDVDVLLRQEGLVQFRSQFMKNHYDPVSGRSRKFIDQRNGIRVDILIAGDFPGSGKKGPIAFPDPSEASEKIGGIRYLTLPKLVELKLAARRYKDFGDVVELIRANNLDESFLKSLHATVRRDFTECLEEKRREDEYEARER